MKIHEPVRPDFSRKSFLIIEDYEGMRGILRDILGRAGASKVFFAVNGEQALSQLENRRFDAVLCDLHLGQGKNGQQVLEEARARRLLAPRTVWLLVSAEKSAEMVMGAAETRPDDYLIKPITETMLFARLQRQMEKKKVLAPIEQAMQDHEYLKALRLVEQQLIQGGTPLQPHIWDLKRLKSELCLMTGDLAQARAVYAEALTHRDLPWARLGLARILFQEGELEEARRHFQQVAGSSRSYLDAHDWLARTHEGLGDLDAAQATLQRALGVSPHVSQRQSRLGDVAGRRGDYETAARAYRRGIDLARDTPHAALDPYLGLARVNLARDQPGEAASALGHLAADLKQDPTARLLARAMEIPILLHQGKQAAAEKLAAALAPELRENAHLLPPEAVFDLAAPLSRLGDAASTDALYASLLANHHDHPEYADRVRAAYAEAGRADEGAALVEKATKAALEIMDQGVRLSRAGKLDEALELLREARRKIPGNVRLLLNHAYLLITYMEKHGRDLQLADEALECIQVARRLQPHGKRAGELLARLERVGESE